MRLTKSEKETIILFNESEDEASIYTYNTGLKNRLKKFSRQYPQLCHLKEKNKYGGVEYLIDKSRLSGSVKNFVALVKNSSFLVRITDMTILIEKEFIYGSSKRPNPTDYYRKQHYQCG